MARLGVSDAYGVVLAKGSKLTPLVNRALAELERDGLVAQLEKRWLGVDVSKLRILKYTRARCASGKTPASIRLRSRISEAAGAAACQEGSP